MKTKAAVMSVNMLPVAKTLSQSVAASVGRTIVRYTYLEWILARMLYDVLGISPKQGRAVIKLPAPNLYVKTLKNLLAFHGATIQTKSFDKQLDAADRARNLFAHSLFFYNPATDKLNIQVVRGYWNLGQDVFPVSRALMPETQIIDLAFLAKQRKVVEDAIRAAISINSEIKKILRALNETRHARIDLDRRRHPQT